LTQTKRKAILNWNVPLLAQFATRDTICYYHVLTSPHFCFLLDALSPVSSKIVSQTKLNFLLTSARSKQNQRYDMVVLQFLLGDYLSGNTLKTSGGSPYQCGKFIILR